MSREAGKDITKEEVEKLFTYEEGVLYWKVKFTDKINIGDIVGSLKKGRMYTKINYKSYLVHRLIFLMHHGFLPSFIDHKDGNTLNNKIENLRECTHSENARNCKRPVHNTSGYKNVQWKKDRNKWKVEIWVENKPKFFGYYNDLELALLVATEARNKYHKEFARHE